MLRPWIVFVLCLRLCVWSPVVCIYTPPVSHGETSRMRKLFRPRLHYATTPAAVKVLLSNNLALFRIACWDPLTTFASGHNVISCGGFILSVQKEFTLFSAVKLVGLTVSCVHTRLDARWYCPKTMGNPCTFPSGADSVQTCLYRILMVTRAPPLVGERFGWLAHAEAAMSQQAPVPA